MLARSLQMLNQSRYLVASTLHTAYALTAIRQKIRYASNKTSTHNIKYVPHAFSMSEAAKRIAEYDSKRLFAITPKESSAVVISEKSPLNAALVPVCSAYAKIDSAYYVGEIGRDRIETYYSTDSKGNLTSHTRIVTDWYPVSGTMGPHKYVQSDPDMSIYFGEFYDDRRVEAAVSGYHLRGVLQDFDKDKIDKHIFIDPWKKVDAYGVTKAHERIRDAEHSRAEAHIRKHNWGVDHVRVYSVRISFHQHSNGLQYFGLDAMMLPIYVLQYPNQPIRILPAITNNTVDVVGTAPISSYKVAAATILGTTVISLFFPQVAIPLRIYAILGSTLTSAAWANFRPSLKHSSEQRRVEELKSENETFSRSHIDHERLNATCNENTEKISAQPLDVDSKYFNTLGLDPDKELTEEELQTAFAKTMHSVHSDKEGGTHEGTIEAIQAREKLRTAMGLKSKDSSKRQFSTFVRKKPDPDLRLKEPPRSAPHPNTGYLIDLVLDKKDYNEALALIKQGIVHPDGHDAQENTLLTEAVKRKDLAGVEFALTKAHCSVDISCDCPLHNTAMHYWAQVAGSDGAGYRKTEEEIFKLLVKHKARINLINSVGKTPLDMTKDKTAIKLLEAQGALRHTSQEGIAGYLVAFKGSFFGYSPAQRTLLMDRKAEPQLPAPSASNQIKKS